MPGYQIGFRNSFTTGFVQYDLLAQKDVRYAYLYPFVEGGAGVLMISGLLRGWQLRQLSSLPQLEQFRSSRQFTLKKDLECACTRGGDGVPLGFISLTKNLMMMKKTGVFSMCCE